MLLGRHVPNHLRIINVGLHTRGHKEYWANLFRFRWLHDPRRMKDILEELGHLPETLSNLYTVIYDQILRSGKRSRFIAENVLKWLRVAHRPLKTHELIAAVSVDSEGDRKVTTLALRLEIFWTWLVIWLLNTLVVNDRALGIFRYAHLSVLEYLESCSEYSDNETHIVAAERCMNTSVVDDTKCDPIKKDDLRVYASYHWLFHYTHIDIQERQARTV